MVLGMPLATFTFLHVLISLVGIASGLIVLERFFRNRTLGLSNVVFLVTTILTRGTGLLFPLKAFGPPHENAWKTSFGKPKRSLPESDRLYQA